MKIALLSNEKHHLKRVYTQESIRRIRQYGEVSSFMNGKELLADSKYSSQVEVIFTTWGMPSFTVEQIKTCLPNLKIVFYGAGSVQHFAKPFLECGIRVCCAAMANAIPVAEYTFAQMMLATKGMFQASKKYKKNISGARSHINKCAGNYKSNIGIVGVGAIGSMIAEKLKNTECEVLAYDPFISSERAAEINVRLVDLKTLFAECDVISNHLANKVELNNIFNDDLFSLMKPNATFINTGRGMQVNEAHLAKALRRSKHRTALIDVIKNENAPFLSPLFWAKNAIMTPHIAGSTGGEVVRMGDYMISDMDRFSKGETLNYEVTLAMLERMA